MSIGSAIGAGIPLVLNGKQYVLEGMTLEDFGVLHNELLKRKRKERISLTADLFQYVKEGIWTEELFQTQMDKAMSDAAKIHVSEDDVQDWCNTLEGGATCLWLMLSRRYPNDPNVSYEKLLAAMSDPANRPADLAEAQAIASGAIADRPTEPA